MTTSHVVMILLSVNGLGYAARAADVGMTNAESFVPPVILAPKVSPIPRINGPKIFGVRPGSPFLYSIPASGERPMIFAVEGLPKGLQLDATTGRITGTLPTTGEYRVTLHAKNTLGVAAKPFRIVVGEEIALTPPMGWNSWNCWHGGVDQEKVLRSARALVAAGLDRHGWTYVNIDDAWQGERGGLFNALQPNKKFPDMAALCREIQALGLKAGIYSTPWVRSYAGYLGGSAENPEGTKQDWPNSPRNKEVLPYHYGKYSFATNDAKQWAVWGIDYLKYDWNPIHPPQVKEMADALRNSGRDIVYSLSNNHPPDKLFECIAEVAPMAQSWRTTTDISDNWRSISTIGFGQDKWAAFQRPGHYNDPDMFEIGANGGGTPKKLTPDEQYTHVSLWCLLSAPLLLGCDLERLDEFTISLLSNDEVLEVDQDSLCQQAVQVAGTGGIRIYAKTLEDGARAVGLFNCGGTNATITVNWTDLKLSGPQSVRDLWRQKNLGVFGDKFSAPVAPHGVMLLRIKNGKN